MFGLFSPNKPFQAQLNAATTRFTVAAGDNLLNAALSSGLPWPHSCRVGSCGTCRCRLVSGKIKPLNDFSYVLDGDELDRGMILACQTRLRSDIEVDVELEADAKTLSPAATVGGVISSSTALTHDIVEIRVRLDEALPAYLAGQYAELAVDGIDQPRSYSFARAPGLDAPETLSFFVRQVPGGEMSSWLHQAGCEGRAVTVSGPHGSFYWRDSDAPALCIAGGSGLAPIKALLEQFADDQNGFPRPVTFLFGARAQRDLYCLDELQQISAASQGRLRFEAILSDEPDASDWPGRRGLVTEFISRQDFDLANCQAYLCGPPPMIDSAIAVLSSEGLQENNIFFDKFLDASHLPGGKR